MDDKGGLAVYSRGDPGGGLVWRSPNEPCRFSPSEWKMRLTQYLLSGGAKDRCKSCIHYSGGLCCKR